MISNCTWKLKVVTSASRTQDLDVRGGPAAGGQLPSGDQDQRANEVGVGSWAPPPISDANSHCAGAAPSLGAGPVRKIKEFRLFRDWRSYRESRRSPPAGRRASLPDRGTPRRKSPARRAASSPAADSPRSIWAMRDRSKKSPRAPSDSRTIGPMVERELAEGQDLRELLECSEPSGEGRRSRRRARRVPAFRERMSSTA